jgi:hypothetical protein
MKPSVRARSPQRQWERSVEENNYQLQFIPETAVTPKFSASPKPFPQKFDFMSYHEKLELISKKRCSHFESVLQSQRLNSPCRHSPHQVNLRMCQSREPSPATDTNSTLARKSSTMIDVLSPSPDHIDSFRRGIVKSPPLKIIKHVRPTTRGGLPKIQRSPKHTGPLFA